MRQRHDRSQVWALDTGTLYSENNGNFVGSEWIAVTECDKYQMHAISVSFHQLIKYFRVQKGNTWDCELSVPSDASVLQFTVQF